MKKKLINHAVKDIASGDKAINGVGEDGFVYLCDLYRIVRLDVSPEELGIELKPLEKSSYDIFVKHINGKYSDQDYIMHESPSVKELREELKNLVCRKRETVLWSNGDICINVRYLIKALEAFNATMYYSSASGKSTLPIIIYEEDDVNSPNLECIMQAKYNGDFKGFHVLKKDGDDN